MEFNQSLSIVVPGGDSPWTTFLAGLDSFFASGFDHTWRTSTELAMSLRTAAFVVACRRALSAREQRGHYL